jgi:hypothetical protein
MEFSAKRCYTEGACRKVQECLVRRHSFTKATYSVIAMSADNHSWKLGNEPPLIRAHSLAKHRVLKSYLERYVDVLTSNLRQEHLRLTLVDGFAGGGLYLDNRTREERPGSPLIMLEAMHSAATNAQQGRTKPFHLDVEYFFIEKNTHAFSYLKKTLHDSPYARSDSERMHLLHGDFTTYVDNVIRFIKRRGRAGRSIFLSICNLLEPLCFESFFTLSPC